MYATACARAPKEKITTESKSFAGNAFGLFARGILFGIQANFTLASIRLALDSGPTKMVPTSALTSPFACPGETRCRLISPREAPAATRASARAGAGFAACAGHAERGGHRPRPTRGSFRGFRRSIKRASRSVRPASTPAFPSARVKRQFWPVAIAIARLGGSSASRGIERNKARGERELTLAAVFPRRPDVAHRVLVIVAQARRRPERATRVVGVFFRGAPLSPRDFGAPRRARPGARAALASPFRRR